MQGIMQLAFHPSTGDNEAMAAFRAARRLAGNRGLDAVIVTKEVVREVVRTRDPRRDWEKGVKHTQRVPTRWQHDYLDTILKAVRQLDLDFELHRLGTAEDRIIGAMEIEFSVRGSQDGISCFEQLVDVYFKAMRKSP
jgi:hypothetical protein